MNTCPLCSSESSQVRENLQRCLRCDLVFKTTLVSNVDEKLRYETHNNDVSDKGYLKYLDKLLNKSEDFIDLNNPNEVKDLLDFGCGPSKGVEKLSEIKKLKVRIRSFDPYFYNESLESNFYDLVYASECFEHFNNPKKTIAKIKDVLKVGGILAISTHLHSPETDFSSWWYLKDKTHVVFYSKSTMKYLCETFGFQILHADSTQIILKKCFKAIRSKRDMK